MISMERVGRELDRLDQITRAVESIVDDNYRELCRLVVEDVPNCFLKCGSDDCKEKIFQGILKRGDKEMPRLLDRDELNGIKYRARKAGLSREQIEGIIAPLRKAGMVLEDSRKELNEAIDKAIKEQERN